MVMSIFAGGAVSKNYNDRLPDLDNQDLTHLRRHILDRNYVHRANGFKS